MVLNCVLDVGDIALTVLQYRFGLIAIPGGKVHAEGKTVPKDILSFATILLFPISQID